MGLENSDAAAQGSSSHVPEGQSSGGGANPCTAGKHPSPKLKKTLPHAPCYDRTSGCGREQLGASTTKSVPNQPVPMAPSDDSDGQNLASDDTNGSSDLADDCTHWSSALSKALREIAIGGRYGPVELAVRWPP